MSSKAQATITASRTKSGWNVKIILGGIGVLAVIILAFTFRLELGLLALAAGGAFAFSRWMVAWDARERARLERRKVAAEVAIIEARADQEIIITQQMTLAMLIHDAKVGTFIFRSLNDRQPIYYPATANERRAVGLIEGPQSEPERVAPLMPLIERESCLCFFGPRGSGKTSIALNWLSRQAGSGLIFDPKGRQLNLWPEQFEVVSDIRQMIPMAERFIAHLERYRVHGRIKPEPYLFFVDELHYLKSQHDIDLMRYVVDIAMFGREYNFHSGFTAQAKTIKALDIDAASLLDNFLTVKAMKFDNEYRCYVIGLDGRETEYVPPAAYPKPVIPVGELSAPEIIEIDEPGRDETTEQDARFVELVENEMSRRQAALEAYGRDYAGAIVTRGKRALGEIS